MLSAVEISLLRGLIYDEAYTRRVLPYVKEEYFETSVGRLAFEICKRHFSDYGECPDTDALKVAVESVEGVSAEEFTELGRVLDEITTSTSVNTDWLIDTAEKWCKDRAIHIALMDVITIADGSDTTRGRDAIPQVLTEALAVGFDAHVGHDYLEDYSERYDFYHLKEERTSFGLDYFDKITKGGIPDKTLNIALAGTGVGKSLFMCAFAANVLMQGKNVLYITLEMAEERIAERIDANLLNTPIQDITEIPRPMFETKMQSLQRKTQGRLYIKEYPTASAHAGHFDALLKELQLKKAFRPDIIFVDYLNICTSARYRVGSNVNSYTVVKAIAEELRGMAVTYNVPVVSATQTTRSGFDSSDVSLTDTSESFGLPATADLMFALISNDELDQMGQIMVKQLKNRYNDPTIHKKFVVGIDRAKMRLYDVDQHAQDDIIEESPTFSYNDTKPKLQKKSFDFDYD